MHGVGVIINHIWKKRIKFKMHKLIGWFLTFHFINISLVLFRAKELDDVIKVFKGMLGLNGVVISTEFAELINWFNPLSQYFILTGTKIDTFISVYIFEMILLGFVIIFLPKNSNDYLKSFRYSTENILFVVFSIVVFHFMQREYTESIFLYFNF